MVNLYSTSNLWLCTLSLYISFSSFISMKLEGKKEGQDKETETQWGKKSCVMLSGIPRHSVYPSLYLLDILCNGTFQVYFLRLTHTTLYWLNIPNQKIRNFKI